MNIYGIYLTEKILSGLNNLGISRNQLESFKKSRSNFSINERLEKGLKNFAFIREGKSFEGQNFLEFGTGKSGVDLLIAYVLGFDKIYTVDINNHLNVEYLKNFKTIAPYSEKISQTFHISQEKLAKRLEALEKANNLQEFLDIMKIEFINFDNLSKGLAKAETIDLWYSESNLQRLPLHRIQKYFSIVGSKFNKDTRAFHRIDMKDIHEQKGYPFSTQSIHKLGYLKHGEKSWRFLSNPDYGYQNRLRYPQFLSLFRSINLKPIKEDISLEESDINYIKKIKLPASFQHLSIEQIAIDKARVLLQYDEKKTETGPHYFWA